MCVSIRTGPQILRCEWLPFKSLLTVKSGGRELGLQILPIPAGKQATTDQAIPEF